MTTIQKTPGEVLDYQFDFAAQTNESGPGDWLQSGETISSATVTVEAGVTKDSDSITAADTAVTVWLSGGTAGQTYAITCQAVTDAGRTVERSFTLELVAQRAA